MQTLAPVRSGRVLGSVRLTRRRAAGHLAVLVTATLTALVTAVLLVSATVLAPAAAESALERTLDDADRAATTLTAATGVDERWPALDEQVRAAATDAGVIGQVTATITGTAFTMPGADEHTRLALGYVDDAAARAELTAGRWAAGGAPVVETVVHGDALDALRLAPGDAVEVSRLTGSGGPITLRVVGAYEPHAPDDAVWGDYGAGVRPAQGDGFTVLGPFLIERDDLLERLAPASASAEWLMPLDVTRVELGTAEQTGAALGDLASTLSDLRAGESGSQMSVRGDVAALVERAGDAASSTRALLLVVVAMLTVLGVWALIFTARLVAARRAPATALMRARGARESTVLRWSVAGTAVPAVVVAVAAPPLADAALGTSALTPAAWAAGVGVAAVWMALMVAADMRAGRSMTSVVAESTRPGRTAAQHAGLDIVVLVLGVLALQQLRRPPEEASEAMLIVAPALVVLAGAVVLVRALPWVARAAAAVGAGRPGAAAMLGSHEAARRTTRHVAASILVVLAVTVSVFAATTQSTWDSFRTDAVDIAEPADVRLVADPLQDRNEEPARDEEQLARLPGVEATMAVYRAEARDGDATIDVVGVDPERAARVMRGNEDLPDARTSAPPAIITGSVADRFGLSAGDDLVLDLAGSTRTTLRVVGVTDAVPGTERATAVLTTAAALAEPGRSAPDEWWLSTGDDGRAAAAAAGEIPWVDTAVTHAHARRSSLDDPASSGVSTGLTAGVGFAAVFVLIGVVVHAITSFRTRTHEYALLRAMGLGRRAVAGSVAVEHTVLLGFSTVTGLGLGLLVTWLVVPHAIQGLAGLNGLGGHAGSAGLPALHLSVPWAGVALLGLAVVLLAAALVVVQTVLTRRLDAAAVLREGV